MGAANDIGSNATLLGGARVLVVEDDFLIGLELSAILSDAGAEVVGPLSTVQSALHAAHDGTLSAAILDVRLGNQTVVPVARQLSDQHVPFFFYTGQSKADPLQAEWPGCSPSRPCRTQSSRRWPRSWGGEARPPLRASPA